MSTQEERKGSVKTIVGLVKKTRQTVQVGIARNTPRVVGTLDRSLGAAADAFADTMQAINRHSAREQGELLRGYRWLLQKQLGAVDDRLASLQKKAEPASRNLDQGQS
jgi:hypothetical protein